MGNKNKTISFRVDEDTFETLREIADRRDLSLSAVFRDYVDTLVAHEGRVDVVPGEGALAPETGAPVEAETADRGSVDGPSVEFPPTVEVSKSFVREHERLELEAEHLREQLAEHKQLVRSLREQLDADGEGEVVVIDALEDEPFRYR